MKTIRRVAFVSLFAAILSVVFIFAYKNYEMNLLAKNPNRIPYEIVVETPAYFSDYLDRNIWRIPKSDHQQPYNTENEIFDILRWDRSIHSLVRFYSTETRRSSFNAWYKDDLVILGVFQELHFSNREPRRVIISSDYLYALIPVSPNITYFYIKTSDGLESYLLARTQSPEFNIPK